MVKQEKRAYVRTKPTEINLIAEEMGLDYIQAANLLSVAKRKFKERLQRLGLDADYFFKD